MQKLGPGVDFVPAKAFALLKKEADMQEKAKKLKLLKIDERTG